VNVLIPASGYVNESTSSYGNVLKSYRLKYIRKSGYGNTVTSSYKCTNISYEQHQVVEIQEVLQI